jgi:hypothetical protein
VVGVWATPFSPWATPHLGFFWRWILVLACKLAHVLLCARLAAVPVRAAILSPFFLCARLFLPARGCSSLRASCTRLLLAARQSCSPLTAAPRLLAAAARWARGWPAAPLPWRPSLVGPPLLPLRCQHPKMMFIFPCFPWFGCLVFCNSCL